MNAADGSDEETPWGDIRNGLALICRRVAEELDPVTTEAVRTGYFVGEDIGS